MQRNAGWLDVRLHHDRAQRADAKCSLCQTTAPAYCSDLQVCSCALVRRPSRRGGHTPERTVCVSHRVSQRITVTAARHVTLTILCHNIVPQKRNNPEHSHAKTIVRGIPASPAPHYITIATTQAQPPHRSWNCPAIAIW